MKPLNSLCELICKLGCRLSFLPPLIARLTIGQVFIPAGWGKLHNLEKATAFFDSLHIPMASIQAPFVASVEFLGGICVLIGLGTRWVSVPLSIIMLVAMYTAKHAEITSFDSLTDMTDYLYFVILLLLMRTGAGSVSIDRFLNKKWCKTCCETHCDTHAKT